jgi:hypothetical protein
MAAVGMKRLLKTLAVGGFSALILGCPIADLALKTTIKSLAAPPNVGSLKIITPASKTFALTWVDPSDKDIDHIEISFATPFASNPPPAAVNVAVGVQHATVTVPLNGVWYFITVKTVDKAGNKSPGITPVNLFNNNAKTLPYTSGLPQYELVYTVTGGSLPGTQTAYYTFQYSGGSSGNLTQQSYYTGTYGGAATLQSHQAYQYDSSGNVTRENFYSDSPTPNTLSYYYVYTYDGNGNQTQWSEYSSGGVQSWYYTYQYDANGNLTTETYYSSPGVIDSTQTYTYDQNYHVVSLVYTNYTNSSYDSTTTVAWDPATNFPSTISFGGSTITFTVSPGLLTETMSGGSTSTVQFNSYGLETKDTGSSYYATYNYDIDGNKTDYVNYNSGTANEHETWPAYY